MVASWVGKTLFNRLGAAIDARLSLLNQDIFSAITKARHSRRALQEVLAEGGPQSLSPSPLAACSSRSITPTGQRKQSCYIDRLLDAGPGPFDALRAVRRAISEDLHQRQLFELPSALLAFSGHRPGTSHSPLLVLS